jgi:hypothetical protein
MENLTRASRTRNTLLTTRLYGIIWPNGSNGDLAFALIPRDIPDSISLKSSEPYDLFLKSFPKTP